MARFKKGKNTVFSNFAVKCLLFQNALRIVRVLPVWRVPQRALYSAYKHEQFQ